MKYSLKEWQNQIKPVSDLIIQASSINGNDNWCDWPIGMQRFYMKNYNKYNNKLQIGLHENIVLCAINNNTDQRRRGKSLINRNSIIKIISNNHILNTILTPDEYFIKLPTYKFIISPEGNGIDCHRHYEALIAGCIPILEKNPLTEEKYKGCPILWTVDYSEITTEYLEKKYSEMINNIYDFSCLFLSSYPLEMQNKIKLCNNYWSKRNII